jgi:hypothetical protein
VTTRFILTAVLSLAVLIGAGVLTQQIGGVTVRSLSDVDNPISLTLSQPGVPGLPTTVAIDAPPALAEQQVGLMVRTTTMTEQLHRFRLGEGRATITIPCTMLPTDEATLLLVTVPQEQVLAQTDLTFLPPDPSCALN